MFGIRSISHYSVTFKVHKQSAEISIERGRIVGSRSGTASSKNITGLSFKAERRMRMVLEDNIDLFQSFGVTTYPAEFPIDGRTVKRHVMAMKKRLRRDGVKHYFWGIEFQKRGAAHINWFLPAGIDPDNFRKDWYEIVGSGQENHLIYGASLDVIRDKSKACSYVIGYARKKDQKEVPAEFQSVGRFWGCSEKVQESGRYTKRFDSEQALNDYINPVIAFQEARLKKWGEQTGKEYKWGNKGNSFILWGGSEIINKFIEGGIIHEEE